MRKEQDPGFQDGAKSGGLKDWRTNVTRANGNSPDDPQPQLFLFPSGPTTLGGLGWTEKLLERGNLGLTLGGNYDGGTLNLYFAPLFQWLSSLLLHECLH
jgi:hypothetical protein